MRKSALEIHKQSPAARKFVVVTTYTRIVVTEVNAAFERDAANRVDQGEGRILADYTEDPASRAMDVGAAETCAADGCNRTDIAAIERNGKKFCSLACGVAHEMARGTHDTQTED